MSSPRQIAPLLVPLVLAACQDITQPPDSGFRLSEFPAQPVAREVGRPTDAPSIPHQSHLGPGWLNITPASSTSVSNCIPFGNNTIFGFTGFIYRKVAAFNLLPGTQFAFDLGSQNDVDGIRVDAGRVRRPDTARLARQLRQGRLRARLHGGGAVQFPGRRTDRRLRSVSTRCIRGPRM
jgi:hypothetical protein